MAVKEETVVPEAGFLRYRYVVLAVTTAFSILSMAWIPLLGLTPWKYSTFVWAFFLSWTVAVLVPADVAAAWIPLHTRSLRYVFEHDRLVAHSGVWYRSKVFVPYARITDISVRQGPLERRYDISRVVVQTAGSYLPEAILLGIGDPDRVRESLLRGRSVRDDSAADRAPSEAPLRRNPTEE